jgi:hypothetical protein
MVIIAVILVGAGVVAAYLLGNGKLSIELINKEIGEREIINNFTVNDIVKIVVILLFIFMAALATEDFKDFSFSWLVVGVLLSVIAYAIGKKQIKN